MPPITALLHTKDDALRLGRTLETLLPCAEVLVVDHDSSDATRRIALKYGARVVAADRHSAANHYLNLAGHHWILFMQAGESITEGLQASLFEWSALVESKLGGATGGGYSVWVRQQIEEKWVELPEPETRLVPREWSHWRGQVPASEPGAIALEGELLRFDFP
jgi:glycosyltransferase involved in cell wall biosynthesis